MMEIYFRKCDKVVMMKIVMIICRDITEINLNFTGLEFQKR